jgi:6-phosphogluconolactonase/glucosamine-6-phosphate isomerase/deaminase
MQFLREDQSKAVEAIATRIGDGLDAGKRVLWLVSGGSNIQLEVQAMELLYDRCSSKLEGLAVLPIDERYGEPGHANSNTQQLREAGFDAHGATWVDVLMHNVPFDQTVDFYNEVAATALANASLVVGQVGLGPDGHIAGILPGSPATEVDEATVAAYEWTDYTRLTLTPQALRRITVAFVPSYGESKKVALNRLYKNKEDLPELPAALLYELPEVYVYNDAISSEG